MNAHTQTQMHAAQLYCMHRCMQTHAEAGQSSGVEALVIAVCSDSHLNEITREGG